MLQTLDCTLHTALCNSVYIPAVTLKAINAGEASPAVSADIIGAGTGLTIMARPLGPQRGHSIGLCCTRVRNSSRFVSSLKGFIICIDVIIKVCVLGGEVSDKVSLLSREVTSSVQ